MTIGEIINAILCVLSFVLAGISVVTVVITLKQNNKMLESNSRPYVVAYLVYQEAPSRIYMCVRNFGKTSAIVKSLKIEPDISLYKKTCSEVIHNTMLAPNQQLHFIVSNEDKERIIYDNLFMFSVEIEYQDCCTEQNYVEHYDISMEYIMSVLSAQHSNTSLSPEQNALRNIEMILDYSKNQNM